MDQLRGIIDRLSRDFGLTPVTAAEVEFYYSGDIDAFWKQISVPLLKHEKERGRDQYEIALSPAAPEKTVADLVAFKSAAEALGADFSAKPLTSPLPLREGMGEGFLQNTLQSNLWQPPPTQPSPSRGEGLNDQPGSGLHIHIHLEDQTGKNVFYKDDERMSDALKFSIGGLLANMQNSMKIFAPTPESTARFIPGGNAPTTVSWGANNRTVAVRLPDAPHDKKRIEHRVAGADADPAAVMAAILAAIHDGLTRKLDPGAQVYGDASLEMYNLPKLVIPN